MGRLVDRIGVKVGLGLAVAQRIAGVFGGLLTAESEPGRGSRFLLRLPEPTAAPAGQFLVDTRQETLAR